MAITAADRLPKPLTHQPQRARPRCRPAKAAAIALHGDHPGHEPLPDPGPLTRLLAQAIAEVLAGARPASQLSGHATLPVIRLLERNAGRLGLRSGTPQRRPLVGRLHIGEPRRGVVEACTVIDTGLRKRALALRLEAIAGTWRCTAVHVG